MLQEPRLAEMSKIDPDVIVIAQSFVNQHGAGALAKARSIVERHREERSEDADFWASIAEMVEAILSRAL